MTCYREILGEDGFCIYSCSFKYGEIDKYELIESLRKYDVGIIECEFEDDVYIYEISFNPITLDQYYAHLTEIRKLTFGESLYPWELVTIFISDEISNERLISLQPIELDIEVGHDDEGNAEFFPFRLDLSGLSKLTSLVCRCESLILDVDKKCQLQYVDLKGDDNHSTICDKTFETILRLPNLKTLHVEASCCTIPRFDKLLNVEAYINLLYIEADIIPLCMDLVSDSADRMIDLAITLPCSTYLIYWISKWLPYSDWIGKRSKKYKIDKQGCRLTEYEAIGIIEGVIESMKKRRHIMQEMS